MKRIAITITILFLATSLLHAEKMRIAVLNLKPEGISKKTSKVISNLIRNNLINSREFLIIERNQMQEILKEQGLQQTGCTDQACAVKLGRLLSARKMLVGEASKIGKSIYVTIRIIDVEKGISEVGAQIKITSEDTIDVGARKISNKLISRISGSNGHIAKKSERAIPEDDTPLFNTDPFEYFIIANGIFNQPVGTIKDGFDFGYGGNLKLGMTNVFFNNFIIGLNTGYYAFHNKTNADIRFDVIQVQGLFGYRIKLFDMFTLKPYLSAGIDMGTYDGLTESVFYQVFSFNGGLIFSYSFSDLIFAVLDISYMGQVDSEFVGFMSYNIGVGFNF